MTAESISRETRDLIGRTIVWDNHSCMPLRPGDTSFLPQLERVRQTGIDVISLNVSFDVVDPHEAFPMLATFRHWIGRHPEHYVLADTIADIERAKAAGGRLPEPNRRMDDMKLSVAFVLDPEGHVNEVVQLDPQ